MIIPIGRGGLCKTSKRLYPPYNPIGIGPDKNPPLLNNVIYRFIYIYSVLVNIVIFSLSLGDLGVITPIGRGGSCETSMRLYPPYNPIGVGPTKPHVRFPSFYYNIDIILSFFPHFLYDFGRDNPDWS